MENNIYNNEEAVSEVIGFIYIFGIVILSMSLIFVMGYPVLQSSMDQSIFESTTQSFIVLQSNIKMVGFDQVPVKTMKMQLNGATLSVIRNSNITISNESGVLYKGEAGGIEYQKNDKSLIFENGGVWKKYPEGTITVSNPRIYTGTDKTTGINYTTIGIVSVNGESSTGGQGIALINMAYNDSSLIQNVYPVNVTLIINSTFAADWGKYLNNIGFDTIILSDSSFTASRNNTMLTIGNHSVDVSII